MNGRLDRIVIIMLLALLALLAPRPARAAPVPDSAEIARVDTVLAHARATRIRVGLARWILDSPRLDVRGVSLADGSRVRRDRSGLSLFSTNHDPPAAGVPIAWERISLVERGRHALLGTLVHDLPVIAASTGLAFSDGPERHFTATDRRQMLLTLLAMDLVLVAVQSRIELTWSRVYPRSTEEPHAWTPAGSAR